MSHPRLVLPVAILLWVFALQTLCTLGCRATETRHHPKVLVVGIDGLEWNVMLPLLQEGKLPHFASLMERGVYGHLTTFEPTLSPVIWTTITTGKPPAAHGILNFTFEDSASGETRLFTSFDRKVKALWNIASEAGRRVNVVGWWNTWPAEEVNGIMVSQFSSLEQGKKVWKGTVHEDWPAQTYPQEFFQEILPVVREVKRAFARPVPRGETYLPAALRAYFGDLPEPRSELERRLIEDSIWAFQADELYARITQQLLTDGGNLTMAYFGGADVAGHRFFRYYQPQSYRYSPDEQAVASFGPVIPGYYRYLDRTLGALLARCGPETTVIVLSDHGMAPIHTDQDFEYGFASGIERVKLAANFKRQLRARARDITNYDSSFGVVNILPGSCCIRRNLELGKVVAFEQVRVRS